MSLWSNLCIGVCCACVRVCVVSRTPVSLERLAVFLCQIRRKSGKWGATFHAQACCRNNMPEPYMGIQSTNQAWSALEIAIAKFFCERSVTWTFSHFSPQRADLHREIDCANRHHKSSKLRLIAEERASSLKSNEHVGSATGFEVGMSQWSQLNFAESPQTFQLKNLCCLRVGCVLVENDENQQSKVALLATGIALVVCCSLTSPS